MDKWNYEELRQRITKVPTTAVSDALDSIGLMNNTVCGLFPTWNCGPVFGRAVTCCNIPASGHTQNIHGGFKVSEYVQPGDVVMVGNEGDIANNGWGGLVSWGAKLRGRWAHWWTARPGMWTSMSPWDFRSMPKDWSAELPEDVWSS